VTFVSLGNIAYRAILDVNLPPRPGFLEYGPPAGALHVLRYMSYELNFRM
jgi:hypothetical protein